jgi:hypothetical protein
MNPNTQVSTGFQDAISQLLQLFISFRLIDKNRDQQTQVTLMIILSLNSNVASIQQTDRPTIAQYSIYAMRWDASLAIIRSLAFVLACDFTPIMPPPHCLRNSSNRSLKLACTQSQPRTCGYSNSGNPPKGKWILRCVAGWRQHTVQNQLARTGCLKTVLNANARLTD